VKLRECWQQLKLSAVKEDPVAAVLAAAEVAGVGFDRLDLGAEAFRDGAGYWVGEVVRQTEQMVSESEGGLLDRFEFRTACGAKRLPTSHPTGRGQDRDAIRSNAELPSAAPALPRTPLFIHSSLESNHLWHSDTGHTYGPLEGIPNYAPLSGLSSFL
jgi:hypothetical protein